MSTIWDCHVHPFGPIDQFPPGPDRSYDPPDVDMQDAVDQAATAGIDRIVWVPASAYGFDNSVAFSALERFPGSRAIMVPPAVVDPAELDRWHALGVRGLRLNLLRPGGNGLNTLLPFRDELKRLGWHIGAFIDGGDEAMLDDVCSPFEVPVVIEHFGTLGHERSHQPEAWQPMLRWMRTGRLWVKMSSPYHCGKDAPGFASLIPLTRALAEAGADQLLFGSNWPHLGAPFTPTTKDVRAMVTPLMQAAGVDPMRVLSINPQRLYGE